MTSNAPQTVDPAQPAKAEFTYEIDSCKTGFYIYVKIHGKAPEVREKLNKIGVYNAPQGVYVCESSKYPDVCAALGTELTGQIVDPKKLVTVIFRKDFQCEDKNATFQTLQAIGFTQNKQGEWHGDYSKVDVFRQAFGLSK